MAQIQASAEYRGTFTQGTVGTVILRINDIDGGAVDPEVISYDIVKDSDSTPVVTDGVPEKVKTGIYVFDWDVPLDQTVGRYTVTWYYTIDGEDFTAIQSVVVADQSPDTLYYSGRLVLMRQSLELMIADAQGVPVYNQPAKPSRDKRTFYWTKGNWNQSRGTLIYLNKEVISDGFTVDFVKGCVVFDNLLTDADFVSATYNFRWFDDEKLDRFLANSIQVYNSYTPFTYYGIGNLPSSNIAACLYGAAVDAIRSLMFSLNWREPAEFFGGPEMAQQRFQMLNELKKNYEETWKALLEQKKLFPYRGLTRAIVTPEYTLPGGRSRWFRYLFSGSGGAG